MNTKERSQMMKEIWARKREEKRKNVEADMAQGLAVAGTKLKTESIYHLGKQVISVYSSEGRITRFMLNDAGNNSFETTIEEA